MQLSRPPKSSNCTEIVQTQYIKGATWLICGKLTFTQKMLSGISWTIFFNHSENKKDLLKLVYSYFQTDECRNLFETTLIINSGENIWSISKEIMKSCQYQTMKKLTQD